MTKPAESPTPKMEAQASSVSRQSPTATPTVKTAVADPTTATQQPTTQISRRDPQPSPQPEIHGSTHDATARGNSRPRCPHAQVKVADAPSATKQTDPTVLKPRTTNATKQETTTSPQVAQKTTEPTPITATDKPAAKPEQRQKRSGNETHPVAQTPTPVPTSAHANNDPARYGSRSQTWRRRLLLLPPRHPPR